MLFKGPSSNSIILSTVILIVILQIIDNYTFELKSQIKTFIYITTIIAGGLYIFKSNVLKSDIKTGGSSITDIFNELENSEPYNTFYSEKVEPNFISNELIIEDIPNILENISSDYSNVTP